MPSPHMLEIDPEIERRLAHELAPSVEQAFGEHMSSGPRKPAGDTEVPEVMGVLDELAVAYEAVGLPYEDRLTPALIEALSTSFNDHMTRLESQFDDPRDAVEVASLMNVSTEANLPHYHADQLQTYRVEPVFVDMLNRWTTEEAAHEPLLKLWGLAVHAFSARKATENKVALLRNGIGVNTSSVVAVNAYTEPQEFATRQAHKNLGRILDPASRRIMNAVAGQEDRHGRMFRKIGQSIFKLDDPALIDYALIIEAQTVETFAMPAEASYPEFSKAARSIARHGLFTFRDIVRFQVERIKQNDIASLKPRSEQAKQAQASLVEFASDDSPRQQKLARFQDRLQKQYVQAVEARNQTRSADEQRLPFLLSSVVATE